MFINIWVDVSSARSRACFLVDSFPAFLFTRTNTAIMNPNRQEDDQRLFVFISAVASRAFVSEEKFQDFFNHIGEYFWGIYRAHHPFVDLAQGGVGMDC
jgi:hypothetical protein